jgi:hypothetical protein
MEKITTAQDDRLLNYLDGKLDGTELQHLKKELESSKLLQDRLNELRIIHRVLAHTTLDTPSFAFTNRVMQNLHTRPVPSSISPKNGLLLLLGVMVAAGMLVVMISVGVFDQISGIVSLDQAAPVKKYFQQQTLPSIPVNGKLLIKIIVGLNLVLAFVVLDRTVLKPFFQKRAGLQL